MSKHFLVSNPETGKIVKVKIAKVWADYFNTVKQFDDLSKKERAKVCCATLIKEPDFWVSWFSEHIRDDWSYIETIGKVVYKGDKKRRRHIKNDAIRQAERFVSSRIIYPFVEKA